MTSTTYGSVHWPDGTRIKSKIRIILDQKDKDKGRLLDGRPVKKYNERWIVIT